MSDQNSIVACAVCGKLLVSFVNSAGTISAAPCEPCMKAAKKRGEESGRSEAENDYEIEKEALIEGLKSAIIDYVQEYEPV